MKEQNASQITIRTISREEFDKAPGESYGGQSAILQIEPNTAAGPFRYAGSQPMITELGQTTVHLATDVESQNQIRLPISATFLRAMDWAEMGIGDVFYVLRESDTVKKTGKGKGNMIPVYKLKVVKRAPRDDKEAEKAF
jgi:hypothetical protein